MWFDKTYLFLFKLGRVICNIVILIDIFLYLVVVPYNHIPYSSLDPLHWFFVSYTIVFRLICPLGIKFFTKRLERINTP